MSDRGGLTEIAESPPGLPQVDWTLEVLKPEDRPCFLSVSPPVSSSGHSASHLVSLGPGSMPGTFLSAQ